MFRSCIVGGGCSPLQTTLRQRRFLAALIAAVSVACLWPQPALAQKKAKAPQTEAERVAFCAKLSESKRRETEICKTDEERREDARQKHLAELAEKEKPSHSSFLQKFHLDGLWIPTSMGTGQYGVIGTHLDVASVGRVHFFGPPGMMMVLERAGDGWRIHPSLTWGVSVYMVDVHLPGQNRPAQLLLQHDQIMVRRQLRDRPGHGRPFTRLEEEVTAPRGPERAALQPPPTTKSP